MFFCSKCNTAVNAGQEKCPNCGVKVIENYEIECPVCKERNIGGSRFCSGCGSSLSQIRRPICQICGSTNKQGAKYCSSCGGLILMTEETHNENDLIEQHKQRMRVDLIEQERLKVVDKKIERKRKEFAKATLRQEEKIEQRKKAVRDYIENETIKLAFFNKELQDGVPLDYKKLHLIAKNILRYSKFLNDPFEKTNKVVQNDMYFQCPVCGAKNSLMAKRCYACGRLKSRTLELMEKEQLQKMDNFGKVPEHKISIVSEKIVAQKPTFENYEIDQDVLDKYKSDIKNAINIELLKDEKGAKESYLKENSLHKENDQNFVQTNTYANSQMKPIVQPIEIVPIVKGFNKKTNDGQQ